MDIKWIKYLSHDPLAILVMIFIPKPTQNSTYSWWNMFLSHVLGINRWQKWPPFLLFRRCAKDATNLEDWSRNCLALLSISRKRVLHIWVPSHCKQYKKNIYICQTCLENIELHMKSSCAADQLDFDLGQVAASQVWERNQYPKRPPKKRSHASILIYFGGLKL